MNNKKLSVIILNWNGLELLKEFLPVAERFTTGPEVQLIVADNGSQDGSPEWIRTNFPQVKLIRFEKNYGFAEGYNKAIEIVKTPYTILLNSDVEVTKNWWKPLLELMENNPDVGACQPKIKSYKDKSSFEYAGAAGGLLDRLGYPYCRGRLFDRIEKDNGQYDGTPADVCWASGAAMMVRTDLYLNLGGLDKLFFAHMEEIDLCCRILNAGFRVVAISDSEVFHVGGASLNQGNPKKTYLNFRNNLLLLFKNLPEKKRQLTILTRMITDTLAFLMFAAKLDFKNAGAIVKAHSDFRKMKKFYKITGKENKINRYPGSHRFIVFDRYFLNKNK